jgi:hypothetical protein
MGIPVVANLYLARGSSKESGTHLTTGDSRLKTEDWRLETGDWRLETT